MILKLNDDELDVLCLIVRAAVKAADPELANDKSLDGVQYRTLLELKDKLEQLAWS